MKFKSALKYQISENKTALLLFYGILYALFLLVMVSNIFWRRYGAEITISGIEVATILFLFVSGLNSFKANFYMLMANGVSRKTIFKSFAVSALAVAAFMAIMSVITRAIFSLGLNYQSLFFQIYGDRYAGMTPGAIQPFLEGLLWMLLVYSTFFLMGYFITALYYRMGKSMKLIVSIGVPVLIFIILPYLDASRFGGNFWDAMRRVIAMALGFYDLNHFFKSMLFSAITLIAFGGLGFLLIRKAPVKA